MLYVNLPSSVGALSMSVSTFVGSHPDLVRRLAEHSLVHSVYSHVRGGRKAGATRKQRRKIANRRRRLFVDNIVMHHKRLHDKNRQNTINDIRKRALEKRESLKKKAKTFKQALTPEEESTKWRDQAQNRQNQAISMRARIESRRARANSRWRSIAEGSSNEDENANHLKVLEDNN